MAITVAERYLGRSLSRGTNRSAQVEYIIQGTDGDVAAADAMYSYLTTNNLLVWDTGIPYTSTTVEQISDQIWIATVQYGYTNTQDTASQVSFDTGGGSQKITQSAVGMAVSLYPASPVIDFKGAINVDDNSVNGVDIVVPQYNWNEQRYYSSISSGYQQTLYLLTGKVNSGSWHGYAQGEALFLGASGSRKGGGSWEMNFKFAASPNKTGIQIGSITGIAKKGWEYLWVRYEKNTSGGVLVQTPASVHVHQVYEYGDFSGLGF
ncbi:MAG: hypothetical protein Q7T18_04920 [Sedimentisphaerales bacterium]|nr:hypothetical protein [Sedimentisphaerales bacterium]